MTAILVWLAALWHDWANLPAWTRRLIGGVVISGLVVGGLALWYHRGTTRAFAAGKAAGVDSVQLAVLERATAQHDSIVRLNDSLHTTALAAATHEIAHARATAAAIDATPRAQPLPVTIDSSGWADLRVVLTAELATKDSLLYLVAVPEIRQLADSAERMTTAYLEEHAERLGADSLAAMWRARALAPIARAAPPQESRLKRIAKLALYTATVWVAARHVR